MNILGKDIKYPFPENVPEGEGRRWVNLRLGNEILFHLLTSKACVGPVPEGTKIVTMQYDPSVGRLTLVLENEEFDMVGIGHEIPHHAGTTVTLATPISTPLHG